MNRFLPLILLLVISRSAIAEDAFWVLGSYVDEEVAREQGSRLTGDTGLEVLLYESIVNNKVQYRLLTGVVGDSMEQTDLRAQLEEVGVNDPWTLRFADGIPYMETVFADIDTGGLLSDSELAEIDAMLSEIDDDYAGDGSDVLADDTITSPISLAQAAGSGTYVVAGSFSSADGAREFAGTLGSQSDAIFSHEVAVQPGSVAGESVFRVAVGPVLQSEEKALLVALGDLGIEGPWLLRSTPSAAEIEDAMESPQLNQDISQPQRGLRIPTGPVEPTSSPAARTPAAESDFNPARLRTSSATFPDPR